MRFWTIAAALLIASVSGVHEYWSLEHCEATQFDVISFQIYFKWSNDELLTKYVHSGSVDHLPFDPRSLGKSEEALGWWRFLLKPAEQSFTTVRGALDDAGVAHEACELSWDSIHCRDVPVAIVARLFNTRICAYHQRLDVVAAKAPFLSGRKRGAAFWLAEPQDSPLGRFHTSIVKYIGGITMFDPTSAPYRTPITKQTSIIDDEQYINHFLWPINTGSNAPVILSGLGLPQFAPVSAMGAFTIAINCKDGSPTNFTRAEGWCTDSSHSPKQLIVSVKGEEKNVTVDLAAAGVCGYLGSNLPTNTSAWTVMGVCNFEASGLVGGLSVWSRYEVVATTVFNDGSLSDEATMQNFWQAEYQSTMRVTIPDPMTPSDIRTLYGIPEDQLMRSNMSAQGILEFSDTLDPRQGFLVSDLRAFLIQYNVVNESDADSYLAEFLEQIGTNELESRGETSLDIEMMMSLARRAKTYLWNIINGPGLQYVHFAQGFIGWAHNVTSGMAPSSALPPSVWSVSYGGTEWDSTSDSATEANTLNDYFKLLTASGVTVVVSSGDSGAGFQTEAPLVSYPASSPYVVAVGATAQRRVDGSIVQAACSTADGNVITSGGGFSQFFGTPEYQASSVHQYVTAHEGYPVLQIPAAQRGVPDIAAIGAWVNILISNGTIPVFGTSISAPVLSSMLSLANDQRRLNGQNGVSLANWMIYSANASTFSDVVYGSNCAGEQNEFPANFPTYTADACYNATEGWDPVSGVGAPRFPAFFDFAVNWTSPPAATGSSPASSHTGAIAGGVIGGIAVIAVVGFLVYRCRNSQPEGGDYLQV